MGWFDDSITSANRLNKGGAPTVLAEAGLRHSVSLNAPLTQTIRDHSMPWPRARCRFSSATFIDCRRERAESDYDRFHPLFIKQKLESLAGRRPLDGVERRVEPNQDFSFEQWPSGEVGGRCHWRRRPEITNPQRAGNRRHSGRGDRCVSPSRNVAASDGH